MHDTPAIIIGMAGAAFLLGSLAPAAIEARSSNAPAVKEDRLAAPRPASSRTAVSTIEVIGLDQATIIFKSRDGAVLFRTDPTEATTAVAKNVDLPAVNLRDEPVRPVSPPPERRQEGGDDPPADNRRKARTIGCEAALSTLVRYDLGRVPSLCLAQAMMPTRS
jgi:hypothetical protein